MDYCLAFDGFLLKALQLHFIKVKMLEGQIALNLRFFQNIKPYVMTFKDVNYTQFYILFNHMSRFKPTRKKS